MRLCHGNWRAGANGAISKRPLQRMRLDYALREPRLLNPRAGEGLDLFPIAGIHARPIRLHDFSRHVNRPRFSGCRGEFALSLTVFLSLLRSCLFPQYILKLVKSWNSICPLSQIFLSDLYLPAKRASLPSRRLAI